MKPREFKYILKSKDKEIKSLLSKLSTRLKILTKGKKICSSCLVIQDLDEYNVWRKSVDGRQDNCKKCTKKRNALYLKQQNESDFRHRRARCRGETVAKKYKKELLDEAEQEKKSRDKELHKYVDDYYDVK